MRIKPPVPGMLLLTVCQFTGLRLSLRSTRYLWPIWLGMPRVKPPPLKPPPMAGLFVGLTAVANVQTTPFVEVAMPTASTRQKNLPLEASVPGA